MILSIKDYMKHFCGKDLLEPMPGEHHFISLCLIPLMLQKLNNADDIKKLKYISPDGAKAERYSDVLLHDITFNSIGLEVKYSRDNKITFTKKQIEQMYKLEGFKGILALRKVKTDEPELWFIDEKSFRQIHAKLSLKARKDFPYWIDGTWERWEDKMDEKFLKIFGL